VENEAGTSDEPTFADGNRDDTTSAGVGDGDPDDPAEPRRIKQAIKHLPAPAQKLRRKNVAFRAARD
jgi:hypothetical protein